MSLGVDPIISNLFFSLNLIPHFVKVKIEKKRPELGRDNSFPFITVIVALYKEKPEDIDITISSLTAQTYPKDRYEILFSVEPDDITVKDRLSFWVEKLNECGIAARVIFSDGRLRTKPHALNQTIEQAIGDYCVFYDASDTIDCDQIEKGISLMMNENYDVVQAKVLRKGGSLLSRFLLLDTVIWYWKYLPIILKFSKGFPLSGEGLFIRRSVLYEMQNFPEVLTEDAYLGIMLAERNKRFALLDSTVVEKTPKNVKAHFRQKLRWHRGYLTCLRRLLYTKMSWHRKIPFFLVFCIPITSGLAFLGWSLLAFDLILRILSPHFQINLPWMESTIYKSILYYWSFFLAYIGIPISILSTAHAAWCAGMLSYASITILLLAYWIFVGFCSICSFFRGTTDWAKTER